QPVGQAACFNSVANAIERFGIAHRERLHEDGVHQREDGGVGADSQRRRENDGGGKDRRLDELPQRVPHVCPSRFQRGPLPGFPAAFVNQRYVAESPARDSLRVFPWSTVFHQLFYLFFQVLLD